MTMIKCQNCGATLELTNDMKIAYCMYCGSKIIFPIPTTEQKALEMSGKIDRLLKQDETENINFAYDIAKKMIELFPSNYLGFLKMAEVELLHPLLLEDRGSAIKPWYTGAYGHISDSLKQAKILASEDQLNQVYLVEQKLMQRVLTEKEQLKKKHDYMRKKMIPALKDNPIMLNHARIIPIRKIPHDRGVIRLYYKDDNSDETIPTWIDNNLSGCLIFHQNHLYYCSYSIRRMGFFESLKKNCGQAYIGQMYDVHINQDGYIVDAQEKVLLIEGNTIRFMSGEYEFNIDNYEGPNILTWKCKIGNLEKTIKSYIDKSFFNEIFK